MSHHNAHLSEREVESTSSLATKLGVSTDTNTERAARSVLDQVSARTAALTFVFYAPDYDAQIVADILQEYTGERGVGGSTAGELADCGFLSGAMVAFSISSDSARAAIRAIGNVDATSLVPFRSLTGDLAECLGLSPEELTPSRHVLLGLFDGLSSREEMIVPFFSRHASQIPLVGGSLGDGGRMERVTLVHDGQVHENAVAITLLEYNGPFKTVQHSHHSLTDQTFEVTAASNGGRTVEKLNGRPAAHAYADALGVSIMDLDERITGSHPLGHRFKGRPFPCSVMRVNDDHSLLLAYSVQVGEQLNLLEPGDLVESTEHAIRSALEAFEQEFGKPASSMLAFHCLGRFREATRNNQVDQLFAALHQLPILGLNTYGEQYGAMHMNHSLTALLFG